jgi:hypothetical protein
VKRRSYFARLLPLPLGPALLRAPRSLWAQPTASLREPGLARIADPPRLVETRTSRLAPQDPAAPTPALLRPESSNRAQPTQLIPVGSAPSSSTWGSAAGTPSPERPSLPVVEFAEGSPLEAPVPPFVPRSTQRASALPAAPPSSSPQGLQSLRPPPPPAVTFARGGFPIAAPARQAAGQGSKGDTSIEIGHVEVRLMPPSRPIPARARQRAPGTLVRPIRLFGLRQI